LKHKKNQHNRVTIPDSANTPVKKNSTVKELQPVSKPYLPETDLENNGTPAVSGFASSESKKALKDKENDF
jgi:hypothetical protein